MHALVLILTPADTPDPEAAAVKLLAPYERVEVEPYKEYLDISAWDEEEAAIRMKWGGIERDGNGYYAWRGIHPNSRWDNFTVLRVLDWKDIRAACTSHDEVWVDVGGREPRVAQHALTPDGEWHTMYDHYDAEGDRGHDEGWVLAREAWGRTLADLLEQHRDCKAVVVDIHE